MKKWIYPFALLIIFTNSCSKQEKQLAPYKPEYYFKFKVNDSLISHNGLMVSSLKPNFSIPNTYDLQIISSSPTSAFGINLHKSTMITRGTYTIAEDPASINAEYYIDNGMIMYSLHTTLMPPAPFSISLTQIEDTYITGSFFGNYMYNEARTDSFRITEGKFQVRRSN